MDWKSILVITLAILFTLLTNKWWLPGLLNVLQGRRINATWAGKEYHLSVEQAGSFLHQQQSAIMDEKDGIVAHLLKHPNVTGVSIGSKNGRRKNDGPVRVSG